MKIKIKSLDTHGQDYEKDFELLKMIDFDGKKEYHYKDEYSDAKIVEMKDSVEIYRRGIINSKQVFKLSKKTAFNYITKEFKGKYEIFTKNLYINNGNIAIEYDIIDGNDVINTVNLGIVYIKERINK